MLISKNELVAAEIALCDAYSLSKEDFKVRLRLGIKTWVAKAESHRNKNYADINQQDFLNLRFDYLPDRSYRKYMEGDPADIAHRNLSKLLHGFTALFPGEFKSFSLNPTVCLDFIIHSAFDQLDMRRSLERRSLSRPPQKMQVYIGGTDDMCSAQSSAVDGAIFARHEALHCEICKRESLSDIQTQLRIDADAYIGLVGLQYGAVIDHTAIDHTAIDHNTAIDHSAEGSVVTGRSRAEWEIIEARLRWLENQRPGFFAPIFIYQPKMGSPLYRVIKSNMSRISADKLEQERRKYHNFKKHIKSLQGRVSGWSFLESGEYLALQVNADLNAYTSDATDREDYLEWDFQAFNYQVPGENELALSGWDEVVLSFKKFDKQINAKDAAPGLCLLLQGENIESLRQVAKHIIDEGLWCESFIQPKEIDRQQKNNKQAVWIELWHAAGEPTPSADRLADVKALAGKIIAAGRPVQVVLCNVHNIENSVQWFQEKVWAPLQEALIERMKASPLNRQEPHILNVVMTYGGRNGANTALQKWVCELSADTLNFKQLILIST